MKMLNEDEVKKLAKLSRLKIEDEEARKLALDIESILTYVGELKSVDTSNVALRDETLLNVMRGDDSAHEPLFYTAEIINNMPESQDNFLSVKKIL